MDDWIILVVVFALVFYASSKKQKEVAGYSKEYHKKQSEYNQNVLFVFFIGLGVLVVGSFIILLSYTAQGLGLILLVVGIIVMFLPYWLYKEEREKLRKMEVKEQKEQEYQSELIKERARLKAQKEENK